MKKKFVIIGIVIFIMLLLFLFSPIKITPPVLSDTETWFCGRNGYMGNYFSDGIGSLSCCPNSISACCGSADGSTCLKNGCYICK